MLGASSRAGSNAISKAEVIVDHRQIVAIHTSKTQIQNARNIALCVLIVRFVSVFMCVCVRASECVCVYVLALV